MKCPLCDAEHDLEKDGRFCASCGMSVQAAAQVEAPEAREVKPSTCRFCGAAHDFEKDGRFCASCGMSVQTYAKTEVPEEGDEVKLIACRFCGMPSPPPTCKACGHKLPVPDEEE